MRYGVFDHMDRSGFPLAEQFEQRLRLIEAYDNAGFYAYHLAEHHATPLGLAPSPSTFLSAVAQRTKRLRLGPLVYTLALYHPLRAYEEMCMLDHLSNGRLDVGFGRGISPIELRYYGVEAEAAQGMYVEAAEIILQACTADRLNYSGKHYRFENVPIEIRPLQRPHPPLWRGIGDPNGARRAAQDGINIVCNGPVSAVRPIIDSYREERAKQGGATEPFLGMSRHIVVDENETAAIEAARPAYRMWRQSLFHLWNLHGMTPTQAAATYPEDVDEAMKLGYCIAGSPRTVRERIAEQAESAGINYLVCRLAFGNLPYERSKQTVDALVEEIMPWVHQARAA